jgi:putative transposase
MKEQGIPVRVICRGFGLSRATLYRYLSSPVSKDPLSKRITELAYEHPQYGYRRIRVLLIKEGSVVNHKKVYRLYTQLSLQKEVKRSRKICSRVPVHLTQPEFPGHVWSADFVDVVVRKRKLRLFFVIDDFTRLIVGTLVDFSIPAYRVQSVLEHAIAHYSRPKVFRTDNGPEFRETAFNRFLSLGRIKHEFIQPGRPYQNGFSESFNARLNEECLQTLDMNLFPLKDIQNAILSWAFMYNNQRPHSSLQYKVPIRNHVVSY